MVFIVTLVGYSSENFSFQIEELSSFVVSLYKIASGNDKYAQKYINSSKVRRKLQEAMAHVKSNDKSLILTGHVCS